MHMVKQHQILLLAIPWSKPSNKFLTWEEGLGTGILLFVPCVLHITTLSMLLNIYTLAFLSMLQPHQLHKCLQVGKQLILLSRCHNQFNLQSLWVVLTLILWTSFLRIVQMLGQMLVVAALIFYGIVHSFKLCRLWYRRTLNFCSPCFKNWENETLRF
ncbi:DNA repair protein [Musa troglodytarum]|uniref:DNA repair protein n=1 Tax=Musa troglodytarum TaxID=320322 RepID=A0A9E7GZ57_9LILI|nr:DNA repair protein [Musa troglodytarum]